MHLASPPGPPHAACPASPGAELITHRRVEFADTDMEGIVHFARFFVFMETAEHELLRALGSEVHEERDGVRTTWPRVEAACRYASPARFGERLEVRIRVVGVGRTSVRYETTFRCAGRLVAEGRTAAVCCRAEQGGALRPVPIDEGLRAALARPPAAAG